MDNWYSGTGSFFDGREFFSTYVISQFAEVIFKTTTCLIWISKLLIINNEQVSEVGSFCTLSFD